MAGTTGNGGARQDASGRDDPVAHAARRLQTALDAFDAIAARQREGAPARRETELMAEDRARMAEELMAAKANADALRQAGTRAASSVREAREAVRDVLDEG